MKNILKSGFYLFFPLIAGRIISLLITNKIDYITLVKPPLAPPKIFFPIAWTIIYLLMGVSYFLLKKKTKDLELEGVIYYIQLFVNALWSIIFFLFKFRLLACFWIVLLDLLVILMIYMFYKKNKVSAYLNIPYLLWILFATYLTFGIYLLN